MASAVIGVRITITLQFANRGIGRPKTLKETQADPCLFFLAITDQNENKNLVISDYCVSHVPSARAILSGSDQ